MNKRALVGVSAGQGQRGVGGAVCPAAGHGFGVDVVAGSDRAVVESADGNLRATVVADVELEKWKSKPYTAVVASLGSPPVYQVIDQGVTYSVNTRLTRLSNVPTDTSYDLVDLRLEVEWQQKKALSSKDQQLSVGASTSRVVLHSTLSPSSPP